MFKLLVLIVLLVNLAQCAFFDPTDIDDPLALFWETKYQEKQSKSYCTINTTTGVVTGECKSPPKCIFSGGTPYGYCGVLGTCCVYQSSCGKSSRAKVSYFEGNRLSTTTGSSCSYEIKVKNEHICQIRLDFEQFRLQFPTLNADKNYVCSNDSLTITPNTYHIPKLCGNNDGQHVYVHINHTKSVTLNVKLSEKENNDFFPYWKIKITQLECPGVLRSPLDKFDQNARYDYHMIAPTGAIQYFTEDSGVIKSFGYSNTTACSYTSGENYAIAFRRSEYICGVHFKPVYMNITSTPRTSGSTTMAADLSCIDYLFVPYYNSTDTTSTTVARVCGSALTGFNTLAPGPLVIDFTSTAKQGVALFGKTVGFHLKYSLKHCGST